MGVRSQIALVLLAAFLLIPLAHAASIDRAWLQWQEHEVKMIAPGKTLPGVVLHVHLSQDFLSCFNDTGQLCAVQLEAPGIPRQVLQVRSCALSNGTILCSTAPFAFSTLNASIPLSYATQIGATWQPPVNTTLTLTLDTTSPQVTAITTGYCTGGVCHIGAGVPTPLTVTFNDTITAFDYRLVFLGKSGSPSLAAIKECSSTQCTGEIIVPCAEGERFSIEIKSAAGISSREDAQNDLLRPANATQFVCRTKGPVIVNLTSRADGIAGQAVSGGSIIVTARVKSGLPVSGRVNVSGILNQSTETTATCAPASDAAAEDLYDCTWQLDGLQPGTFTPEFRAYDPIGLYGSRQQKMTVLHLRSTENRTLDMFSSQAGKVTPEQANRAALELARSNYLPYPTYVQYSLSKKNPRAKLYRQELKSCVYKMPNETNYTSAYNLFSFGGQRAESHVLFDDGTEQNRMDLQIRADPETLARSDTFNVRCELHLTVGEGNDLYDAPEVEQISFDLRLRETVLGQPGGAFVEKIKREEARLSGGTQDFLLDLREVRATMDGICQTIDSLNGAIGLLTGAHQAAVATRDAACASTLGIGCGVMQPVVEATDGARGSIAKTKDVSWYLNHRWVREVCYQVNCRGDVNHGITETLEKTMPDLLRNTCGDAVTSRTGSTPKEDVCNQLTMPNPEDSFVMSALTMCTGGMIYNAGKWQDINCGYLQCLKEQSLYGSSTAVCEAARSYKTCTQLVGETFELPFINIVTNLAENINSIIEQLPQYIFKWSANQWCENLPSDPPGNWKPVTCKWLRVVFDTLDYADATKRGFDKPMSDNAICLQALCNPGDDDCKLTFNRAESITRYASYLQINTWLVDQKQRTGTTTARQSDASKLIAELDAEWSDYCADKRCGPDGYHIEYSIPPRSEEIKYRLVSNVAPDTAVAMPSEYYDPLHRLSINPSALDTPEDYETTRKMIDEGIVPRSQADLDNYRKGSAKAEADPQAKQQMEMTRQINQVQRLELQRQRLLEKRTERIEEGKSVDSINEQIGRIDQEHRRLGAELETAGYFWNPEGPVRWTQALPTVSGDDYTAAAAADPNLVGALELETGADGKYLCGSACKAKIDACASNCEGYTISGSSGGEVSIKRDVTADVEGGAPTKSVQRQEVGKYGRLFVSVAVQILRDKGYLDWLSISYYGDWGVDLVDTTNTYLTKEGWSRNICNAAEFDVGSNDDGAIYALSEADNPLPVGMFAAEVRRLEEGESPYAYVMAFLVTNPVREKPAGIDDAAWAERNTFTLDIKMTDLAACAARSCPQEIDLVNGTYLLGYGGKFSSGDAPRRAIVYLPGEYRRICITFNKEFPGSEGQRTYCRSIKENVYERGSPPSPGSSPSGGTTPAPSGGGTLMGDLG